MRRFFEGYWKIEQSVVPGLRSSQYAYYEELVPRLHPGTRWLDTGCGHQVFPEWMRPQEDSALSRGARLVGIDLDREGLRRHRGTDEKVYGDLTNLPFAEGSFEVVSANMVVEHLVDPRGALGEMRRVLVGGGTIIVHTVNRLHWALLLARYLPQFVKHRLVWFFEGRPSDDVFKTHYRMNSVRQIESLARQADLEVVKLSELSGTAALAAIGLLALPELVWIRLLRNRHLGALRSNLIVVLRKPAAVYPLTS